jgi:cytochrome b
MNHQRIVVWDLPTRIFHWSLAASFIGAYLTAESERWRDTHVVLGYTVLGLIGFRLIWGFVGTRHARFAEFVRGPAAVSRYVSELMRGQAQRFVGHNPAGAVAIVVLLILGIANGVTGWLALEEIGGDWSEEIHEFFGNAMLAVVVIHVVGVIVSGRLHKENLILAMVTGRKQGSSGEGITGSRPVAALLLLAALLGFWAWSYQNPDLFSESGQQNEHQQEDDDD